MKRMLETEEKRHSKRNQAREDISKDGLCDATLDKIYG